MTEEEEIALDEEIDSFITKRLSEQEEQEFQKRLKNDPELQEKVKRSKLIRDLVIDYQLIRVRNRMREMFLKEKNTAERKASSPEKRRTSKNKSRSNNT